MLIPTLLEWQDEMQSWRRHLHQHPETAFEEVETARFVAERLSAFGMDVHRGLAGTGVVATLRCGDGAAAIGLRADMDALAIHEANEFGHRSLVAGKMHACGHDGHTAMLLGAARYLAQSRSFDGTVHFIFQPAEENEGGGRRMVAEGLFERFPMQAVFGMHNIPGIPIGRFAAMPGPMMASFDIFEIIVEGRGAHAAMPHMGVDAIIIASELTLALNTVVSRNIDPIEPAVLSVTQLQAGETWNASPETARLRGTVRAFSTAVRDTIERRMRELAESIAIAHGGRAKVMYERRYPPTINDAGYALQAQRVIATTFGADALLDDAKPIMAAEDFAYMLQAKQGCYIWLGNGAGSDVLPVHNPRYDFNDAALAYGATYWVRLVESLLPLTK
jgi:hippurate hydrolase